MKYLLTTLLAILCLICNAQEIRYRHYDVENGLSNNKVNCIFKDSKGLLWIGTPSGLNRFDGYAFKSFFSVNSDTTTLASNLIETIQEDADGNMLIGCGGTYTIYMRREDRFVRDINNVLKKYGLDIWPKKMLIDNERTLWMHDTYNGAFFLTPDGKSGKISDSKHLLTKYAISDIIQIESTICFINRRGNIIAVNAKTHTIQWFDNTIERNNPDYHEQNYSAYCDRQNRIWISSIDGAWVYNYSLKKWDEQLTNAVKGMSIVRAITQDSNDNIWIGQDQRGLSILNTKTLSLLTLNDTERMGNKTISSLYTDNDGNIWIGTYKKGLYQYNEKMFKFNLYDFPDVNCIAEAGNGIAWIGTDSGNLIRWNRTTSETTTYTDLADSNKPIVSLCTANDGTLWIGTYRGGLKRFSNGKFTDYGHKDGLTSNNIWSIVKGDDGCLWLGTLGGGLQHFNPMTGAIETYDTSNSGLTDDYINSLYLSKSGLLYIGTTQGIAVMNVTTRKITNKLGQHDGSKSFASPNIAQLCEDSRGLLWIATPDGLYVYDSKNDAIEFVKLTSIFANQYVLGLVEDKQGSMWASVGSDIVRIKVTRDKTTDHLSFTTHSYTQCDGLQSSDFNQRSFCRMDDGSILVGGLYGINSFSPANIKYDRRAPKVIFVEMRLFNQPVKVGDSYDNMVVLEESLSESGTVNLKYSQNEFTIYFATDSHIIPEKTIFYYRLKGFNSEWMECPSDMHQVTYTNLTPGTYTLEVKAVNNDGTESDGVGSLQIVIHPPFWLTGWAKVLYAFIIIWSIFMVVRTIKRRERKKYIAQKKAEAAKQEEKLAQMKFQFFTNISHELRTPLTLILSPLEAMLGETKEGKQHDRLRLMHNNAKHLLYLVNQLLDFRKNEIAGLKFVPAEDDVIAFTKNICDTFVGYSENKHVHLTYFSSCEQLRMLFDGDKLSKIVLNLLSNAFKFTPDGGRVDVAVTTEDRNLIIKVSDTGIGIADSDKERIFERFYQTDTTKSSGSGIGLSLVSEYVKLHDGTVKVVDNVGGGSVFIVSIPIKLKEQPTEAPAVQEVKAEEEQKTNAVTSSKPVVLVVDDNLDLQTFLRGELSKDYNVITADNGRIALDKIEQRMPDIILSDIMMPEMDGIELCRRIKSDEKYASIPLIILSAKHDEQAKVEGLTLGADDYITKPFNCDLLMLRMKKLIELNRKGVQRTLIEPEPTTIEVTSLDEKLVEAAVKYVEANMSRPDLSVEELSRELGMSRVHLYKRLRQVTGKTPTEFIRVLRLKRAAQLLRESQLNVSEIAYQVGFNTPKYFSTYFKDEFGVSPSVYQDKEGI